MNDKTRGRSDIDRYRRPIPQDGPAASAEREFDRRVLIGRPVIP